MSIERIPVGVSSCLLGQEVRYDGGHMKHDFAANELSKYFEWVPVCPEMEIGLGSPREPIDIHQDIKGDRLIGAVSGEDLTGRMNRFSEQRTVELSIRRIRGYILKKDSPSCGNGGIPVYNNERDIVDRRAGFFARSLGEHLPSLPVAEESDLSDPDRADRFLTQVFTYDRWCELVEKGAPPEGLREFHEEHHVLLEAYGGKEAGELKKWAAEATEANRAETAERYELSLISMLRSEIDRARHLETLERIADGLDLDSAGRRRMILDRMLETYRSFSGSIAVARVVLISFYSRLESISPDIERYLEPYPTPLATALEKFTDSGN